MKNQALLPLSILAILLTGWFLLSSGMIKLPSSLTKSSIFQDTTATPTPSIAPQEDLDTELEQTDQDLEQTNPDEFSSDVFLDTKLGL